MEVLVAVAEGTWTIVHGDTSRSPAFAICTAKGRPVDLDEDWVIRAQARKSVDDPTLIFGWSLGHGIDLSTGWVKLDNRRTVETSTIALSLLPGDFSGLPREWSGVVEIEIASDSTPSPAERYSVARIWTTIVGDVTRDEGTIIVDPGVPAPSAPAGGVLAGSYPNPVFAVPMATNADVVAAVNAASVNDRNRANHSGTQSADTLTDGATKRAYLATERAKLAGIAEGATVNASDAALRDRALHTGTQPAASISDLSPVVRGVVAAMVKQGTNVAVAYDAGAGTLTISAAGGGGGGGGGSGGVSGVRTVSASTTAFTGEILLVDASGGQRNITPPTSPPVGTQVGVVKTDSSANSVVWTATTNGASNYALTKQWQGATFTFDGTYWYATATNRAFDTATLTYADISGQISDAAIPSLIAREQKVTDAINSAISTSSAADRSRPNHTGTQGIGTVTGLQAALDARAVLLTSVTRNAAYTALPNDYTLAEMAGGAWTLTLPTAPPDKTRVGWKVVTQASSPNNLTVACGGTDRFNTTTGSIAINAFLLNQAAIAQYSSATGVWVIQSSDLSLTQLDLRYVAQTQRGPLGGVVDLGNTASGGTITPNAALSSKHKANANAGNVTLNPQTGGVEGQPVAVAITATGAARVVTIGTGITRTLGQSTTYTIPQNTRARFLLECTGATTADLLNISQTV